MVPAAYVRLERLPLNAERQAGPECAAGAGGRGVCGAGLRGAARGGRGGDRARSGRSCWAWSGSAGATISSSWAGIRCWRCRLISRLRQALGVEAGLAGLFARPTLSELAASLEGAARAALPAIAPAERGEGLLPLSFAQQRLWFLSQFEGASEAYHIAGGLRLSGALDRAALKRALDRIVARHEALRTTFSQHGRAACAADCCAGRGFCAERARFTRRCGAESELLRLAAEEAAAALRPGAGPADSGPAGAA